MKFLVIGYGSIGKRHTDNLKNILKNKGDIIVCRKPGQKKVAGLKTFFNLKNAFAENPLAAIIATPPSLHIPIALKCAKRGLHLFIEKPLSNNLKGLDQLVKLSKKYKLTCMIGCNLRFHPGLTKLKNLIEKNSIGKIISVLSQAGQYLPDWRKETKYQNTYSAKKSFGGGVVLDLIHELDYLYWFFGKAKKVFCFADKSSTLNIDTEDNADILLKFKNNIQANLHLDYIQRCPQRSCQIIGEKGTIIWDYYKNSLRLYIPKKGWRNLIFKNFDRNDMYVDEMKHFIECIKNKQNPLIDLKQGIEVLKIALVAKESSEKTKVIKLD